MLRSAASRLSAFLNEGIRDLTEALKPAIEVFSEHQPEVT